MSDKYNGTNAFCVTTMSPRNYLPYDPNRILKRIVKGDFMNLEKLILRSLNTYGLENSVYKARDLAGVNKEMDCKCQGECSCDNKEKKTINKILSYGYGEMETPMRIVLNKDTKTTIQLEIPGYDLKDISVKVVDNRLSISGERQVEELDDDSEIVYDNFTLGDSFEKSFALDTVNDDVDNITADLSRGILTVTIPAREKPKPVSIEVKEKQ